jgi:hypothetical protein
MAMDGELETTIFVCMRPGLEGLAASYDFSGYLEPKEKLVHVSDFWNGWTDDDDEKEPCLVLAPVQFCALLQATPAWEAFSPRSALQDFFFLSQQISISINYRKKSQNDL